MSVLLTSGMTAPAAEAKAADPNTEAKAADPNSADVQLAAKLKRHEDWLQWRRRSTSLASE